MPLSDTFIQFALDRIDAPDVIGISMAGSYGRGQETKYSDVDFDIFVSKLPKNPYDRYTLRYWDNKLISLKYILLAELIPEKHREVVNRTLRLIKEAGYS